MTPATRALLLRRNLREVFTKFTQRRSTHRRVALIHWLDMADKVTRRGPYAPTEPGYNRAMSDLALVANHPSNTAMQATIKDTPQ